GEAGWERNEREGSPSRETTHPKAIELTVSQPLYRGGRTTAETDRAEAQVQAARAKLHSVEQEVLLATARAYMNVLRNVSVVSLNRANEKRVGRQLQAAKDRFQVGEITRTDVAQAEARLARAKADRIQAEGLLVNSKVTYRRVIGDPPVKLSRPKIKLTLPANSEEASVLGRQNNPDVLNARYLESAAEHDIALVRGELLPSLRLVGSVSHALETASSSLHRDTAEIMAEVTVPLYQQGEVYSRLRESRQTLSRRKQELDDAERAAVEAAASAWNVLQTASAAVNSFQAEVRANEIALDGVQREALVGSRTVLDVLDAEQELLDASVNLVRAQRNEVVSRFTLKSAVGSLSAANLKLQVDIYDAEKNYRRVRNRWFGGDVSGSGKTR
ncbi:MAG: TolC family outer membrane protein, partial [Alphaproteobacteria bacterium]|nr:TolC family outer membrane protein [Alphaproteobacteria bacterium]